MTASTDDTGLLHEAAPSPSLQTAPALTLPDAEAAFLRAAYEGADVILEYGSGGSTAMGAAMPGKTIWTVESDKGWMDGLVAWFEKNPPAATLHLRHGDIGPTKEWGKPIGRRWAQKFHHYPLKVWDDPEFTQPDVVFIDGRFRAGCFLATAFRTQRTVNVYFDDYVGRKTYHEVERLCAPTEIVGRMARFEVSPQTIDARDLVWIMNMFARIR